MTDEKPSRFKMRREARRRAEENSEGPVLTEQDTSHLKCFEEAVDDMIEILNEENEGLDTGQVHIVTDTAEKKDDAARKLENKYAVVETILSQNPSQFSGLRTKFEELKDKSDKNGILLERMGIATRAVVREIEKVKERHSLNGMYSASGRKRSENLMPTQRYDEKL